MKRLVWIAWSVGLFAWIACNAARGDTGLILHFDGNLAGTRGQTPITTSGVTYETGVAGLGASFTAGDVLRYASATNIDSQEGTLEFWYKPRWIPGAPVGYDFLEWGGGGGMVFVLDGAGNLRSIFNRYLGEVGTSVGTSNWSANQWHHIAYTWSSSARHLYLYVDGTLRSEWALTGNLPAISDPQISIGSSDGYTNAEGILDEMGIYTYPRTASQILSDYLAHVTVTGLQIDPASLTLWKTWTRTPNLIAQTPGGALSLPAAAAQWQSLNTSVATVDAQGKITAVGAGTCTLRATIGSVSAAMTLTVKAPVLPPQEETVDPYLAAPASGYQWEIPVVSIRVIPTLDGVNVDGPTADFYGTVAQLKANIAGFEKRVKFALEERSRFHGYKNPSARPSLGYRVVRVITVYEPLPPYMQFDDGSGWHQPDYGQIIARFGAESLVRDYHVKEFWVWGYHNAGIYPVESNMSSPTTGDISNSYRLDDLPVYDRTYTVYGFNFTRTENEALEDHGHQIEAILNDVAQRQDGTPDLFRVNYCGGIPGAGQGTGRAGNVHCPPNTRVDYDWANPTLVLSDGEDWTPAGTGAKKYVNKNTWGNLTYAWPATGGYDPGIQAQYFLYWWQNMPGWDNTIPYAGATMTNWWRFTGDWDLSIQRLAEDGGLYGPAQRGLTAVAPSDASGVQGGTVALSARMTRRSNGAAVAGKTVSFLVDGAAAGSAVTDASGIAVRGYTIPVTMPPGARTITASFAGDGGFVASSGTATLAVGSGVGITGLRITPTADYGSRPFSGTVTLNAPAPSSGLTVTLSSDSSAAVPPASVTVTGGATTADFQIQTTPVAQDTVVTITASTGSGSVSAPITVKAPLLSSLALSPSTVRGGLAVAGTVKLNAPAPAGLRVLLSSSAPFAIVPASVSFAGGAQSATFSITTGVVATKTTCTIKAVLGSITKSVTLTVRPISVASVALSPGSLVGGRPSTGTVTLEAPAAPGSISVALSSSSALAQVVDTAGNPLSSVVIPAGSSTVAFAVRTGSVSASTSVKIRATANGLYKEGTLTLKPIPPVALTVTPNPVVGSRTATGSVGLDLPAAPGSISVALTSSNPAVAQVVDAGGAPIANVTVPSGQPKASFWVKTAAVTAATSVTIQATANGVTKSVTLKVTPIGVAALTLNPSLVNGGAGSTALVTLAAPAAPGSLVVALSSGASSSAWFVDGSGLPITSVTIAAGQSSVSVPVRTAPVTGSKTVTLKATANGVSGSAALTIAP